MFKSGAWPAFVFPAVVFIGLAVWHSQPLYLIGLGWCAAAFYVDRQVVRRRRRQRESQEQ